MDKMLCPPEGRTFVAQCGKFWTSCLDSGRRKNELKIEIQMKFSRVLTISLDVCQKIIPWSDPTRGKLQGTLIAGRTMGVQWVFMYSFDE